jgi:SAM-dependent methyltransferase
VPARDYAFPVEGASTDFAFATSVFTHMRAEEVRHYLAEIARVLKPAGRAFLTFFMADGPTTSGGLDFRFAIDEGWTIDAAAPERAIAYPEPWVRDAAQRLGLVVQEPIRRGTWSGSSGLDFQDALIVCRPRA